MSEVDLAPLLALLQRVPTITGTIGSGVVPSDRWWVKFRLDIHHALVWRVVQQLGHVLKALSHDERLPTTFHPVSPPPPYMNCGPDKFLSWVIELHVPGFAPVFCAEWLEGRAPSPVEERGAWDA